MATVLHQNTFTLTGRGERLAMWEGELTPGDLVSFVDSEVVPGYSLHLRIAEDAHSHENRMAASLDGYTVVFEIQQLKVDYPVDRWFCSSRYLLRYCSALSLESTIEFSVSLVIDGKFWLDYDLGMKREGFKDWLDYDCGRITGDGPGPRSAPGPWGKLEWWARLRPTGEVGGLDLPSIG